MDAKAKLLGHPIHQMLIVFPLGLLATSFLFDIAFLISHNTQLAVVSFWMIIVGVGTGLLAALFGFIDWLAVPGGTRAKAIGGWHGGGNVVVVVLFLAGWWLRRGDITAPPTVSIILSAIGVGIALITGWLGGELVDRLGVGVDDGANLNAPNSITTKKIA